MICRIDCAANLSGRAEYLFIASLLGAIVQMTPHLGMDGSTIGVGAFLLVAAFLIWYSKQAESKGWMSQKQTVSI